MSNGVSGQAVTFDVQYREGQNRLTTFFRYFTALPHSIVLAVWGYAVYFVTIGQWFVTVFTGKRSRGIWEFQRSWLAYGSRVESYVYLTHDAWPQFGTQWGHEPVAFDHGYVEKANRLTSALRMIWAIPAMIVLLVFSIGLAVVVLISWFAILFTGRMPRGMFDFAVRVLRYALNVMAYALLMTDVYPRYEGSETVGMLPPGDHGTGGGLGRVPEWENVLATPLGPPPIPPGGPLPPPTGPQW